MIKAVEDNTVVKTFKTMSAALKWKGQISTQCIYPKVELLVEKIQGE